MVVKRAFQVLSAKREEGEARGGREREKGGVPFIQRAIFVFNAAASLPVGAVGLPALRGTEVDFRETRHCETNNWIRLFVAFVLSRGAVQYRMLHLS